MDNKLSIKFLDIIAFYGPFKAMLVKCGSIVNVEAYRQIGNEKQIYFDNHWRDIKYYPFKPLLKEMDSINESDAIDLLIFLGVKHINQDKKLIAKQWVDALITGTEINDPKIPKINPVIVIDFLKSKSYNVHGLDAAQYIDMNSDVAFR